ncbi:MAG: GNAT family N-acetyltransferase [Lachnospiraceae bacterium]|nr:GNAT family N-acetyltransferase [Lachnospiraceae bacterium]
MLKKILFALTPAIAESQAVQTLLHALETAQIESILSTIHTPSPAYPPMSVPVTATLLASPGDCLMVTDSATEIAAAKKEQILCIGYAPPETNEDMSGAYALFEDFTSVDVNYFRRMHAHGIGYPAEILTTKRLILREFSEADFPKLYAMCTEPSTASFMEENLSDYETERDKHNAYLRNVYPFFDLALWGVYEKKTGALIGRAGFSLPEKDSDTFSLGYLIDVPYRKLGYAKELIPALLSYAKEQGYSELSAYIKKENTASITLLEHCCFPYKYEKDNAEERITYTISFNE